MRAIITAILFLASTAYADTGLMRTWTASSGKKVQAEIVRIDGPSVILKNLKGEQISIRGSSLSKHDIEFLDFYKDFRTEKYDGTGAKIMALKFDIPVEKWMRFIKWRVQETLMNDGCMLELLFPGDKYLDAYWKSPIPAINMETLRANIIDLQKDPQPQWFICRRRSGFDQIEENIYKTWSVSSHSVDFTALGAFVS